MAKLVNEQPTSGHFVAVWVFGGSVWSDAFEYIDGRLHRYCPDMEGNGVRLVIITLYHHKQLR